MWHSFLTLTSPITCSRGSGARWEAHFANQAPAALLHGQRTTALLRTCSGLEATSATIAALDQGQGIVFSHKKVCRVRQHRQVALTIAKAAGADALTNGTENTGAFSAAGIAGAALLREGRTAHKE